MTRDKAVQLVEKLARVAAPGSGASEAERTSAALEACRLIAEHNLSVAGRAPEPPRRRPWDYPPRSAPTVTYSYATPPRSPLGEFRSAIAPADLECCEESCADPIFRGERVWSRIKNGQIEYVHADCWHD